MIVVKMGFRNFWRQKARNIYTLIAVAVGSASLICIGGYTNRWENTLKNDAIYLRGAGSLSIYKEDGRLLSRSKPKKFTLSAADVAKIRHELGAHPEVEHIGSFLRMTGLASNGCNSQPFEVLGYDPELDATLRAKPEVRRWCGDLLGFIKGESFAAIGRPGLVGLASGLASLLGKASVQSEGAVEAPLTDLKAYCEAPGARERIARDPNLQLMGLTFDGHFGAVDADIAHIFSTGSTLQEDTRLTAPLALVQELYQTERASHVAIYLKDHSRAERLMPAFAAQLKAAGLNVEIFSWNDRRISPFYHGVMSFIRAMDLFCTLLISSVVALCVINLTTMNVLERSREIGTLKAIGFPRSLIARIFLAEASLVAAVGSALGLALALLVCHYLEGAGIRFHPPGFTGSVSFILAPSPVSILRVLGLLTGLVLLASGWTSFSMARRSSLELLTEKSS